MKHYSPEVLERAVSAAPVLKSEEQLLGELRRALDGEQKAILARRLGISAWRLTSILRGHHPLPAIVAERLGYRRLVRFERTG